MSKHMTKEELRRDEFAESMARALAWVQANFMAVLTGVFLLAAVIIGSIWIMQGRERARVEASQGLYAASSLYQQGRMNEALPKFEELSSRFAGTVQGRYALYYQGAAHLALGENDAAVKGFDDYLAADGGGLYAAAARLGKGLALEGQAKLSEAAAEFRAVRQSVGEDHALYSQAVFAEARVRQSLGETEAALEVLRPLMGSDDFATRQEAETRISVLEAFARRSS